MDSYTKTMTNNDQTDIKVSVIVPVYNVEGYIARCIKSLREQTLTELEFIFVNDCSTDNSIAEVEMWAARDKRVHILHNEKNMGPGYSRNRGIEEARGEYLSFIDPDDYVATDFFELLYRIAKEDQTDIAKGLHFSVKADGSPVQKDPQMNKYLRKKLANGVPLYGAFTRGHQNTIYRREFVVSHNIRYSLARRGEDVVFLLKVCSNTNKISFSDEALYYYCERKSSTTHTTSPEQLGYYFDSFCELVDYALNYLPEDKYTKAYLQDLFQAGIQEIYRYNEMSEMEHESLYYLRLLRAQWLRIPNHDDWIKDCCSLRAMQEYGYLLPTQAFRASWDVPNPSVSYVLFLKRWIDFYLAIPRERKALSQDLEKNIAQTRTAVSTSNNHSKKEKQGKAMYREQMRRLPLRFRLHCITRKWLSRWKRVGN